MLCLLARTMTPEPHETMNTFHHRLIPTKVIYQRVLTTVRMQLNLSVVTLPTFEILSGKNAQAFLVCGFLMKSLNKNILKIWNKSWEPFGSYLLNSTANPAHFHPNWAGLAVLFSRQLLNGSHDLFHIFRMFFLNDFIKNPQTRNARAFLPLNNSAVGSVSYSLIYPKE